MTRITKEIGPWGMIPRWVIRGPFSDGAVRLYGLLADLADRDDDDPDSAKYSRSFIALRLRVSVRTVSYRLWELEKFGAVEVKRTELPDGSHEVNEYMVIQRNPHPELFPGRHGDLDLEMWDDGGQWEGLDPLPRTAIRTPFGTTSQVGGVVQNLAAPPEESTGGGSAESCSTPAARSCSRGSAESCTLHKNQKTRTKQEPKPIDSLRSVDANLPCDGQTALDLTDATRDETSSLAIATDGLTMAGQRETKNAKPRTENAEGKVKPKRRPAAKSDESDPLWAEARRITKRHWDPLPTKPMVSFKGIMAQVHSALEKGHTEAEVDVVLGYGAYSNNAMDFRFSQMREQKGKRDFRVLPKGRTADTYADLGLLGRSGGMVAILENGVPVVGSSIR